MERRAPRGRSAALRSVRQGLLALVLVLLGGCARGCVSRKPPIHLNPNMDDQPRYEAQEASPFFRDGAAMRPEVLGTVARGELPGDEVLTSGKSFWSGYARQIPLEVSREMLRRGAERFEIYCTPCHGPRGDGRGPLLDRAGVKSADLLDERVQLMPPGEIFAVVTQGRGLMPGYAYPISAEDRWAIVAWIKQLHSDPVEAGLALSGFESVSRGGMGSE